MAGIVDAILFGETIMISISISILLFSKMKSSDVGKDPAGFVTSGYVLKVFLLIIQSIINRLFHFPAIISQFCNPKCRTNFINTRVLVALPKAGSQSNSRIDTSYCILDHFDVFPWTPMNTFARSSIVAENAGGQSDISEAWSINYLMAKLGAISCVLEMDIKYFVRFKMVDYILTVHDEREGVFRIGASVTRAMSAPNEVFTRDMGIKLLKKKLYGLVIARNAASKEHSFFQSILHIFAPSRTIGLLLMDIITNDTCIGIDQLEINGTLDIWITITEYSPIFTNGFKKR